MSVPPLSAIRSRPPVAALTVNKMTLPASCARTRMYTHSTVENGFRDWTPRIDFRTMPSQSQVRLYLLCSSRQRYPRGSWRVRKRMGCRQISLGVDKRGSYLRMWDDGQGEHNNANGCNETGMSDANVKDLNGAKWTHAVKNSLVRFIIFELRPSSPKK